MAASRKVGSTGSHQQPRQDGFFDPRFGTPPILLESIPVENRIFEPKRTNCFSVYLVEAGVGTFWADTSEHAYQPHQLLFFIPYQRCRFEVRTPTHLTRIQFHANFLCVETFHAETGCSGALFNDPYGVPLVNLDEETRRDVKELIRRMQAEQTHEQLGSQDALLACMRLLLIVATRLKPAGGRPAAPEIDHRDHILEELREHIERNYQQLHAPAAYAEFMHMTPQTLGRYVRETLGKTLTDLIRQRILTHAKWQLLHTLKPVKQVAAEVGFRDELYFSRVFKKATGVSPRFFREFETEIRNGSNLSMSSTGSSIPDSDAAGEDV